MGIREKLNQKPQIATGATIGIIVLALLLIVWQVWPSSPEGGAPKRKAYFTVDDGATTFTDEPFKLGPFDRNGQQAVRVHMFSCDGGKTRFVGYLSKLTDQAAKKAEAAPRDERGQIIDTEFLQSLTRTGLLVKEPGAKKPNAKWVALLSPQGTQITMVNCPDGQRAQEVFEE